MRIPIDKHPGHLTLDQLYPGDTATVSSIEGGSFLRARLESLGIHVGDTVSLVSRGAFRGPVLITVHGSQVALGRGVAQRVFVTSTGHRGHGRPGLHRRGGPRRRR